MRIIWRNPNKINPIKRSIIKTGYVEAPGGMYLFYRSALGEGILGTEFEVWMNRSRASHAA